MTWANKSISRTNKSQTEISRSNKFIAQCLSQIGELLIYKVDLAFRQIQLIRKLRFQHISDTSLIENVIDHQIHPGSNAYTIALTDQGNIHIHDIYTDEDAYRGTI